MECICGQNPQNIESIPSFDCAGAEYTTPVLQDQARSPHSSGGAAGPKLQLDVKGDKDDEAGAVCPAVTFKKRPDNLVYTPG